ncbi:MULTISPECIES: PhaM family polyhydroxyalkanoate granule multifunctional regulatory protein [Paraburkholderia]|uniref:Transcriptional regulator n=1 Tax=Paraburkholderia youngii TaxID=2782701 RepID=A0A7Y6K2Y9_9BURK|nr:PhaM family polyhydroxyalkanoate granule multifunctional regulatory protein [Paraburkholderia youngii]NUY03472.1 transcriptional regulator [Paraburkholderia youngii]
MTDTTGSAPPFPGFPGFPPAEMLDRMWSMIRLSPFGAAMTGAQPGGGTSPSLSMMSDMMAPLTSVEELDKRITDMRAVEQWLKLNLSMLQSAIQALEVQRATLATLRAFGAFAQTSMSQAAAAATGAAATDAPSPAPSPAPAPSWTKPAEPAPESAPPADRDDEGAPAAPGFDASAWWNLLQSQFNQIAQFAMTQPSVAVAAAGGGTQGNPESKAADPSGGDPSGGDPSGGDPSGTGARSAKPAAKRPAAKRVATSAKRASGEGTSAATQKKST